jgi:hypothetical protein
MTLAFLFGSLGALMAEIIKRWDQLASMPEKKFNALLRSIRVWAAVLFLVILGGLGGIFTNQQATKATWQFLFVSGAGMMLFVRNIVSAAAKHQPDHLGKEDDVKNPKVVITLRDIFN